jgi:ElaA protein
MEVFVEEQRVPPEEEMDELDATASHVLATLDGEPVGTGRLIVSDEATAKVGRMAVLRAFRGRGVGSVILAALLALAVQRGIHTVRLSAQLHAIPFYERFGFEAQGAVFLEAGIKHRMMQRPLD